MSKDRCQRELDAIADAWHERGVSIGADADSQGIHISTLAREGWAAPGTARAAMEEVLGLAEDRNLPVTLHVWMHNERLIEYYEEMGFEAIGLAPDPDGANDHRLMERRPDGPPAAARDPDRRTLRPANASP